MGISQLVSAHEARSTALAGVDGEVLTCEDLLSRMGRIRQALKAAGLTSDSRVAVVMPNGVEMAVAMMGIMSGCAAAPINPALGEAGIGAVLDDLKPDALLADPSCGDALAAARRREIPLLDLAATGSGETCAGTNDIALLLYTSGTTSKPKLVPLTQANLAASARNISDTLGLTPADRTFNVMPFFHVHGLVGALLASLAAGGSCVCAKRYEPYRFLRQIGGSGATWYSAVPTIHQAVTSSDGPRPRLRFVRSCSSHLAVPLWREIEDSFGAPVVNCYGMSEAAHQITSGRRHATVGTAGATAVSILGGAERGEVAICGPAVMSGYLGGASLNHDAFRDGWLRTGDEGSLDVEGNLTLHGRLKEIINRGGEKISPFEVDEVFQAHPAVRQAIAFPVPHRTLGEEVGLAVVLRPGQRVEERQLVQFGGERLARFKLPRRIWILDEIPKGPTGKPQRNTLAARLGEKSAAASAN